MVPSSLLPLLLLLLPPAADAADCGMRPSRLRTNGLADPLGVSTASPPLLSWALEATSAPPKPGLVQSAYRVQASSTPPRSGPSGAFKRP